MEQVAGYHILGELGRGGAGTVYLARQDSLNRRVALKVVSTRDPDLSARLLGEAQLLGELRHPNIIAVYDTGLIDGRPWYSMTYCGGGTLAQVLQRDGALTPGQVVGLVSPLADALATLHERGVVHRDVKPGNVLFDDNGTPYLGDFGTALDAKAERVTTSGAVLGTIGYTAPEMVSGGLPSPASDVFSLGVLAYEALAGVRPFAGSHIVAVIDAIRSGSFIPLMQAAPGTPPQMAALIEQALAVNPAARPRDLRAWSSQLRATVALAPIAPVRTQDDAGPTIGTVSNRVVPAPIAPVVEAPAPDRRRTAMIAVGAVAAFALTLGGVVLLNGDDATPLAAEPAPGAVILAEVDLPTKTANGTIAASTWTIIEGAERPIVRGTTTITNELTEPALFTWDEIIPKELVSDAGSVVSTPSPSSVVRADPILRYCLQLQPGAEAFISWRANLETADLDQATLETLARAWSTEFDSHASNPGGEPCTAAIAVDATTTTSVAAETVVPTTEAPPEVVAQGQPPTVTTTAPRAVTNTTAPRVVTNTTAPRAVTNTTAAPITPVTTAAPTTPVTTAAPVTTVPPPVTTALPPAPVTTVLPAAPVANNDSGASVGSFRWNAGDTTRKCSNFPLNVSSLLSNDTGTQISAQFVQQNMSNTSGGSELTSFSSNGTFSLCMTRSGATNIGSFVVTYRVVDAYGRLSGTATATVFLVVN